MKINKKKTKVKPSLPRNALYSFLSTVTALALSPTLYSPETLMAAIEDDEVAVILEEQREEIMAAKNLAHDHDLDFNLHMQEALAASRAAHTSSPDSPPVVDFIGRDAECDEFDYTSLILEDIARVDQEKRDREFGEQEMKRLKVDLDRRIHDQKFAKEIMNIPDADWSDDGDFFQKPYSLGASSSSSSAVKVAPFSFSAIGDDEFAVILEEQREEIMAAKTLAHDHDLAFNLQMQEALAASRAAHTSSPDSPPVVDFIGRDAEGDEFDYTSLILEDIARVDQERRDREFGEQEMKRLKVDLDRRIHDQKFAKEIMNIPDADWSKDGDFFQKPYSLGASSSSSSSAVNVAPFSFSAIEGEGFRVYCKGLVSEEMIGETRVTVGGVGVAICDSTDNLIWEVTKVLGKEESKSPEIAELEAIVHGLDEALTFDLGRVTFFIDDFKLFNYVTGRVKPRQSVVATLVNQVSLLQKKFSYCQPSLLTRNDVKFVFKFARDAIVSQIKWPEETSKGKAFKETCVICYEGITVDKMFSIDGCFHRFCFSCMKQHVEVKLLEGKTASCPRDGCKSEVKIDSCAKFLDPKLVEVMIQRKKEDSISVSDKVYCPYPKCSELMSKAEVLEYTKQYFVDTEQSAARKCMKCGHFFCMLCKVPWHYKISCNDFSKSKGYQNAGDGMLKSLAQSKQWRQCLRCNNMVELVFGCYHITCRCGYEFCYTCGAEWKNKKATCACPIWDEHNIIREGNENRRR